MQVMYDYLALSFSIYSLYFNECDIYPLSIPMTYAYYETLVCMAYYAYY